MNETTKEKKSFAREVMEWIVCIVIAFGLALLIKYYFFTPTLVMQQSMTPTILNEERVLINRTVRTFNSEIKRGDIITFEAPSYHELEGDRITAIYYDKENILDSFLYNVMELGKKSYIKRVIGIAGDKVRIEDGSVYINDILQEEKYLPIGTKTYIPEGGMPNEFVVPEGYVFAMGDNRGGSSDCRSFGCIPLEKIEGRVYLRIWPLNRFGSIDKEQ
ncbi:MAG: signal peptidase I [Clostridia bacterium]|nr:signal peptidase I [Clostridia bacterium]